MGQWARTYICGTTEEEQGRGGGRLTSVDNVGTCRLPTLCLILAVAYRLVKYGSKKKNADQRLSVFYPFKCDWEEGSNGVTSARRLSPPHSNVAVKSLQRFQRLTPASWKVSNLFCGPSKSRFVCFPSFNILHFLVALRFVSAHSTRQGI